MVTKVKAPSYTAQHRATLKPTIVEDVVAKPTLSESIHADVKQLYAKYKVEVPSTTRYLVSCVAAIAIGFGIGFIGSIITETLLVASMMLTGSLFIGVAMYMLGVIATIYVSLMVNSHVYKFIMSGDIDRSYQKYSNAVVNTCSSMFGAVRNRFSNTQEVAA